MPPLAQVVDKPAAHGQLTTERITFVPLLQGCDDEIYLKGDGSRDGFGCGAWPTLAIHYFLRFWAICHYHVFRARLALNCPPKSIQPQRQPVIHRMSRRQSLKMGALGVATAAGTTETGFNGPVVQADEPCFETVPRTSLSYHLIAFKKLGDEIPWNGELCSQKAIQELTTQPITDVFIFSHGWMGDVPQAKAQYRNWIAAMAGCQNDIDAMKRARPGFLPLLIGIHWPSLPFGDEELRGNAAPDDVVSKTEQFAERISNTPRSRQALQTIIIAAKQPLPDQLPPELVNQFRILQAEAGLQTRGAAAAPGADVEKFDPRELFDELRTDRDVRASADQAGAEDDNGYYLLYLLALVSFWTMKDRARVVGESGGRLLLKALQDAVPRGRAVRFHLMGHSFGCIVVSSMLQGARGDNAQIQPVHSLSLVQGALSLWSYCSNAYQTKVPGYFRPLLDGRLVSGPIVTTHSTNDTAVRVLYPYAAGVKRQLLMADGRGPNLPKYGGLGMFGIQGDKCDPKNVDVLDTANTYGFKPGVIYNIECSRVINKMSFISGAHSDICHPEVAHAIWEAARVEVPQPSPAPRPPTPGPSPDPAPRPGGPIRRFFQRRR